METVYKTLLGIHVAAGFISLMLFWVPIFTAKGQRAHRLAGKYYVRLMWIVVTSAAVLSVRNAMIGNYVMAAFLGFIALITSNPLWYGIAILRNKHGLSQRFQRTLLAFNMALVLAALALISFGFSLKGQGAAVLMFIFGGLGLTALPDVLKALRKQPENANWMKQHIVGMCTSGIAAYTAFLVFGANQLLETLLSGYWSIVPWVAPAVVGSTGIRYMVRKYARKPAAG